MYTGRTILIVEDDKEVAETIREQLQHEGYACCHAADGEAALAFARRQPPDLILLDRMLPRVSGDEVAQRLKSDPRSRGIPIIMLTGKADESDQLVGFALGADDYINKPFSPRILLARIAAQFRQRQCNEGDADEFSATSIELDRRQPRVYVDKTAIPLTSTEYRLLATLMAAGGTVLHREQLTTMIFGRDTPSDEHVLEGQVGGLKRKMGNAAGCIHTVADGVYAFCPPRQPRPTA